MANEQDNVVGLFASQDDCVATAQDLLKKMRGSEYTGFVAMLVDVNGDITPIWAGAFSYVEMLGALELTKTRLALAAIEATEDEK